MKTASSKAIIAALIATASSGAFVSSGSDMAANPTPWKISADLEEACSCRGPCPCWFKAQPTRMTCDGAQVIFISKGRFGKIPLDGLAVAQFVQSPEGKSMFESFGNWNLDNVYIDERANDQQREALKAIASHLFPPAGKSREFHFARITRSIQGPEHVITVGRYGEFAGHLIEGGNGGPPKIINPPLADPTHMEFLQGAATRVSYSDAGQNWKHENSNYMFNKVTVDSKQYQKFEADMARKMGAMKTAANESSR